MPKAPTVRVDRIELRDPNWEDEYRFVEIDEDGDIFIADGTGDERTSILIRKSLQAPLVKAIRMVGKL